VNKFLVYQIEQEIKANNKIIESTNDEHLKIELLNRNKELLNEKKQLLTQNKN